MDDNLIVTAFVVRDDMMVTLGHQDHGLAQVGDAEILTVTLLFP